MLAILLKGQADSFIICSPSNMGSKPDVISNPKNSGVMH